MPTPEEPLQIFYSDTTSTGRLKALHCRRNPAAPEPGFNSASKLQEIYDLRPQYHRQGRGNGVSGWNPPEIRLWPEGQVAWCVVGRLSGSMG